MGGLDDIDVGFDEPGEGEFADVDEQARSAVAKIEQLVASGEYSEAAGEEAKRIALEAGRLRVKTSADDAVAASERLIEASQEGQITTAAALADDEDETPPEPGAGRPAYDGPGEWHGPFLVVPRRGYGEGWAAYLEQDDDSLLPVGIWLHTQHPHLDAAGILALLTEKGLPDRYATSFARHRQGLLDAPPLGPAVEALAREEQRHVELKDEFSRRFVAEQKKKAK